MLDIIFASTEIVITNYSTYHNCDNNNTDGDIRMRLTAEPIAEPIEDRAPVIVDRTPLINFATDNKILITAKFRNIFRQFARN